MPVTPISLGMVQAFLLRGERAVLVDAGMPGSAERILRAAAAHGVGPRDISLILLTHSHQDHTGSAGELRERTGAPLAIHSLDARALRQGTAAAGQPTSLLPRLLASLSRGMQSPALEPDILLDGELDLSPYGVPGRAIPTPGHTPGSVSILLPHGEAILGDLARGGMLFRRRPALPFFLDDREQWRQSLDLVLGWGRHTHWVSHGGPLTAEDLRRLQQAPPR